MPPRLSAATILVITLILIIIPTIFIINGLIDQVSKLPEQIGNIEIIKQKLNESFDVTLEINENQIINQLMPLLTNSIQPIFENIINMFLMLFLLFFLLYYLIIHYDNFKKIIEDNLPFSEESNKKIISKLRKNIGLITKFNQIILITKKIFSLENNNNTNIRKTKFHDKRNLQKV